MSEVFSVGAVRDLPQHLVNGLVLGSLYSLLALGYSMVYGVLRILNFAHGDIFMAAGFVGWAAATVFVGSTAALSPFAAVLASLVAAMIAGTILGVLVERVTYRPLRKASRLAPLLSAIGASLILQNSVMLVTKGRAKTYPSYLADFFSRPIRLGSLTVSRSGMLIVAASTFLAVGMSYAVSATKFGRMMRATAEDPEAARYMGIPTGKVVTLTFALGSALAGAAGVLVGLHYTQVDFMMGFPAGMKAFTAAVLGGIGNLNGAMLGGIALGVAESLGVGVVMPVYKDAISFAVLIVALILRPGGILGDNTREKV